MKLPLTISGVETTIEILSPPPRCRFRIGDGPEREADVENPEPGVYSILTKDAGYEARVEETPAGAAAVHVGGYRFEIELRDPRRWYRSRAGNGPQGRQNLSAPMPGKVVRLLVAAGQEVAAGEGLVVVEAMKMQNEIKAARAGRVLSVSATEGAAIAAGEVLITIE